MKKVWLVRARYVVLICLVAINCSMFLPRHNDIHPEIKPIINRIYKLSNGNLGGTIVRVGFENFDEDDTSIAKCYNNYKEISIDLDYWKESDLIGKILTVAHELAHCEKGIKHINGHKGGCPAHFMHYMDASDYCSRKNFKKYVKQMREI